MLSFCCRVYYSSSYFGAVHTYRSATVCTHMGPKNFTCISGHGCGDGGIFERHTRFVIFVFSTKLARGKLTRTLMLCEFYAIQIIYSNGIFIL